MISSSRSGQNDSTCVVVIWGPPGVGKTALVEEVYSQFLLNNTRSFALCGWVQVSNPFNLAAFSRSLLSILRPESPQSRNPTRDCSNLLRNHPCLVVIDGLQCMEDFYGLENAGLIYGHRNSCIILITTEKSVTTSLGPDTYAQLHVKPLHWQSARKLFTQVSILSSCIRHHFYLQIFRTF